MRKLLRLLILLAFVAAVAYVVRRRLVPTPEFPVVDPPRFRVAPHEPAPPEEKTPEAEDVPDDLTEIHGVGPVYAMRLADQGIGSFSDLAGADATSLAAAVDVSAERVEGWIDEARGRSG